MLILRASVVWITVDFGLWHTPAQYFLIRDFVIPAPYTSCKLYSFLPQGLCLPRPPLRLRPFVASGLVAIAGRSHRRNNKMSEASGTRGNQFQGSQRRGVALWYVWNRQGFGGSTLICYIKKKYIGAALRSDSLYHWAARVQWFLDSLLWGQGADVDQENIE